MAGTGGTGGMVEMGMTVGMIIGTTGGDMMVGMMVGMIIETA